MPAHNADTGKNLQGFNLLGQQHEWEDTPINLAMDQLAQDVIAECRKNLILAFRFMSVALWRLPLQREMIRRSYATNGAALFYNPFIILGRFQESPNEAIRDVMHSIMHCVFHHPLDQGMDSLEVWSIACDICVEATILEMCGRRFVCDGDSERAAMIEAFKKRAGSLTPRAIYRLLDEDRDHYKDMSEEGQAAVDGFYRAAELFSRDIHDCWACYQQEDSDEAGEEESPEAVPDAQKTQQGDDSSLGTSDSDSPDASAPSDDGRDSADGNQDADDAADQGSESSQTGGGSGEATGSNPDLSNQQGASDGQSSEDSQDDSDPDDDAGRDADQDDRRDGPSQGELENPLEDEGGRAGEDEFQAPPDAQDEPLDGSPAPDAPQDEPEGSYSIQILPDQESTFNPEDQLDQEQLSALREEWERISKSMAVDLQSISIGHGVGALMDNLAVANRKPPDYDEFLRQFATIAEDMVVNDDEFDYIFYTFGMEEYDEMPFVEPLEYKETERVRDFCIAIDTSQSCSGELVKTFVKRTYDVLRQADSFGHDINVHIIQCDLKVQSDTKITSLQQLEEYSENFWLRGFGGTDFRPVFEYVDKLVEQGEFTNLKGLIYFTDGMGTFPAKAPDYDTAFVFVEDGMYSPKVPPWAMRVVMTEDEIGGRR